MNQGSAALATGMVVSFGRSRGEHTLGEVVKVTRKNVKVVQLEPRGANKTYEVGSMWLVPKDMVTPVRVAPARVEAGKKSAEEHQTETPTRIEAKTPAKVETQAQVVKLKRDAGIIPVPGKGARAILRGVALKSAGVTPSGVKTARNAPPEWAPAAGPPSNTVAPDEQGCPVLIDPVTQYRFVGHKGEDLAPFIERILSVVSH